MKIAQPGSNTNSWIKKVEENVFNYYANKSVAKCKPSVENLKINCFIILIGGMS